MPKLKKGDYVRTKRRLDMRDTGGPDIPKGTLCEVFRVRRTGELWVDVDGFGQRHLTADDVYQVFVAWVVAGSAGSVAEIGDDAINFHEYKTEAELAAFVDGVDAAEGWNDVHVFSSQQEAAEHVAECKGGAADVEVQTGDEDN